MSGFLWPRKQTNPEESATGPDPPHSASGSASGTNLVKAEPIASSDTHMFDLYESQTPGPAVGSHVGKESRVASPSNYDRRSTGPNPDVSTSAQGQATDLDRMEDVSNEENKDSDWVRTGREDAAPPPPMQDNESTHGSDDDEHFEAQTQLLRDLETRAITVPQLVQEVKGIYAGLVMVETKCNEIINEQNRRPTRLSNEQYQALIALHRTLLNEHHDFFSASHHPATKGHELRELASRYAMPARMWRHGIHSFLELLRKRLPDSLEHMLSFIYLAYSMIALLKETVPDFLETWIECLGDLARYRMAIEEKALRDREVWAVTAKTWYDAAADLSPNTGRIQHHLAVLARPNIVQQLFLYSKSLVAAVPFVKAEESLPLLFDPLLDPSNPMNPRYQGTDRSLVTMGAVIFRRKPVSAFFSHRQTFVESLDTHMARSGPRFKVQGVEIAGSLFAMMFNFGNEHNKLWQMLVQHQQRARESYCKRTGKDSKSLPKDFAVDNPAIINVEKEEYWSHEISSPCLASPSPSDQLYFGAPVSTEGNAEDDTERKTLLVRKSDEVTQYVGPLLYETISIVAGSIGNKNVVPFMHTILAYLYALTFVAHASVYIERCIPWWEVVQFLNTVGRSGVSYENVESSQFPKSYGGSKKQLPEDFVLRGLMAMTYYYPQGFFDIEELVDEDERLLEQPSHQAPRVERCLWAAVQLAGLNGRWLTYDRESKQFATTNISRSFTATND